jgi:hypothetical protein
MPNQLTKQKTTFPLMMVVMVGVFLQIIQIFRGNSILHDSFHYGEFFASATSIFNDSTLNFHPLIIHGALDFLPALAAKRIFGPESYFLPTYAIYKILNFIAAAYLVLIAYQLTKYKNNQFFLITLTFIAAPFLVGYRDLFLLIALHLFLCILDARFRANQSILLHILFGFIVGLGLFWSYDRGIAGAISLGMATISLLPNHRQPIISLASFVGIVFGMGLFFDAFSFESYLSNIFTLMQTSGKWSYGLQRVPALLTLFVSILNFYLLFILLNESFKAVKFSNSLPILICLGLLSLFMLKIGVNRADLQHIYMSLLIPLLISLYLHDKATSVSRLSTLFIFFSFSLGLLLTIFAKSYPSLIVSTVTVFTLTKYRNEILKKFTKALSGLLIFVCLGFIAAAFFKSDGQYNWLKSLSTLPSNRSSSTEGVIWASDRLKERSVECVFDLSNNGIINGLLHLPSCSRFTYPIYAGPQHEDILIFDLSNALPAAIVYSSTFWSYNIDGQDMKIRFPKLDEFIMKKYTNEVCNHGYCIRHK